MNHLSLTILLASWLFLCLSLVLLFFSCLFIVIETAKHIKTHFRKFKSLFVWQSILNLNYHHEYPKGQLIFFIIYIIYNTCSSLWKKYFVYHGYTFETLHRSRDKCESRRWSSHVEKICFLNIFRYIYISEVEITENNMARNMLKNIFSTVMTGRYFHH